MPLLKRYTLAGVAGGIWGSFIASGVGKFIRLPNLLSPSLSELLIILSPQVQVPLALLVYVGRTMVVPYRSSVARIAIILVNRARTWPSCCA